MTLKEAEKLSLQVLKNVMEEKIDQHNVEVASVEQATGKFRIYTTAEVNDIIATLSQIIRLFEANMHSRVCAQYSIGLLALVQ